VTLLHSIKQFPQRALTLGLALLTLNAGLAGTPAYSAEKPPERNFYDVLEDVLGDFEYDLKNNNVSGLKSLSIRNIAVSESVPASFKNHLELLLTERILRTTRTNVIQCLPCRARHSMMDGDKVVITSAETNSAELTRIANQNGIEHFMDAAFAYQPTGLVLSMYIVDPQSGSVVWSRSYNSEVSRAEAVRRGVDPSQMDDLVKTNEYRPVIQYHLGLSYFYEPNIGGATGCIGLNFRVMERYDHFKKEVGFELDYFKDGASISGPAADASVTGNIYSGFNLTGLFQHAWNFIGEEEDFNRIRSGVIVGIGGTYASGYLAGLVRATYEWRMGKRFSAAPSIGYRPSSTAYLGSSAETGIAVGGLEFGLSLNLLF
jgi:TolB-like protein